MTETTEDDLIARVLQRTATVASAPKPAREAAPAGAASPGAPAGLRASGQIDARRARDGRDDAAHRVRRSGAGLRVMPGLDGKARVATAFGALPIEALRRRDELRTSAGNFLRVQKIDRAHLDEDFLHRHEEARPLMIRAGALGRGLPARDVVLSPQQEICTTKIPQFSSCKRVGDLTGLPGILAAPRDIITYYSFDVGEPALLSVEGLWVRMGR